MIFFPFLLVLLLLTSIPREVLAGPAVLTVNYARVTVRVEYDTATNSSLFAVARYDQDTRTLSLVRMRENSTLPYVICRAEDLTIVGVGPVGCSDPEQPSRALVGDVCPNSPAQEERWVRSLENLWYIPKNDTACLEGGGVPGITCLGPALLARSSGSPILLQDSWNDPDLSLSSIYTFLLGCAGPSCTVPTVTQVEVVQPYLEVVQVGDCEGTGSNPFDGQFEKVTTDAFVGFPEQVLAAFERRSTAVVQRLLVYKVPSAYVDFRLVFAQQVGTDTGSGYYDFYYQSDIFNVTVGPWVDWNEVVDFTGGTSYPFSPFPGGSAVPSSSCNVTLTLTSPSNLGDLVPPEVLTPSTWSLNKYPPATYHSRLVNFHVGRYDENLDLVYPYTPDGDVGGGYLVFRDPRTSHVLYVPPNPLMPQRWDCDWAYPLSPKFLDLGGTELERMQWSQQLCFYPFLDPDEVLRFRDPKERYDQCRALGGWVYGRSKSHCASLLTQVWCKDGWMYYLGRCHYVWTGGTDDEYLAPVPSGVETCLNLGAAVLGQRDKELSTPLGFVSQDGLYYKFLRDYLSVVSEDAEICVRMTGTTSRCVCFLNGVETDSSRPCGREAFVVCTYPDNLIPVPYKYQTLAYQTGVVLAQGQEGAPPNGHYGEVRCFSGWSGEYCQTPTCGIAGSLASASPTLVDFLTTCQASAHGDCYNGQPRICRCHPYWGPPASIVPGYASLYRFRDTPCTCPAGPASNGTFVLNEVAYNGTFMSYLPCNGASRGSCTSSNFTSEGTCDCVDRPVLREDREEGLTEDAYDGKDCACPKAILPFRGYQINGRVISSSLCNAVGRCCPHGQSVNDPIGTPELCFDGRTDSFLEVGCLCPNGLGGEACTCEVPVDYAWEVPVLPEPGLGLYVDLGELRFVNRVEIKGGGCSGTTAVDLYLSLEESPVGSCTQSLLEPRYWDCWAIPLSTRYVVAVGASAPCALSVWDANFTFCGDEDKVSPYAGRFYDNSGFNVWPDYYPYTQNLTQAASGCQLSECLCNGNYTGYRCNAAVSALRLSVDGEVYEKHVCGEDTLNPIVLDPVQGRGAPDPDTQVCKCAGVGTPYQGLNPAPPDVGTAFVGRACQCATVWVQELNETLTCAGQGDCMDPSMPEGYCSGDWAKFVADPLYTPFVRDFGLFGAQFSELEATGDNWVGLEGRSYLVPSGSTFLVGRILGDSTDWGWPIDLEMMGYPYDMQFSGDLTPIQYVVHTRWWDPALNQTFQEDVGPCDLAKAPPYPGDNSTYACPHRLPCRSWWVNRTCEDPVAPTFWDQTGTGDPYTNYYSGPIGCICNVTTVPAPSRTPLPAGRYNETVFLRTESLIVSSPLTFNVSTAVMNCADPFYRTVDYGLWLSNPSYELFCRGLPVTGNDSTVGWAFGIMGLSNPICSFKVPLSEWGACQYSLVSSALNDLVTLGPGGDPVDVVGDRGLWYRYMAENFGDPTLLPVNTSQVVASLTSAAQGLVAPYDAIEQSQFEEQYYYWDHDPPPTRTDVHNTWGVSFPAAAADALTYWVFCGSGLFNFLSIPLFPFSVVANSIYNCEAWTPQYLQSTFYRRPSALAQYVDLQPFTAGGQKVFINSMSLTTAAADSGFKNAPTDRLLPPRFETQYGGHCGSVLRNLAPGESIYPNCIGAYPDPAPDWICRGSATTDCSTPGTDPEDIQSGGVIRQIGGTGVADFCGRWVLDPGTQAGTPQNPLCAYLFTNSFQATTKHVTAVLDLGDPYVVPTEVVDGVTRVNVSLAGWDLNRRAVFNASQPFSAEYYQLLPNDTQFKYTTVSFHTNVNAWNYLDALASVTTPAPTPGPALPPFPPPRPTPTRYTHEQIQDKGSVTTGTLFMSVSEGQEVGTPAIDALYQDFLANRLPFNGPYQSLVDSLSWITTTPVNVNDPVHQNYLKKMWSTHFAPRVSSGPFECGTFGMGIGNVYPYPLPNRPWYNGPPEAEIPVPFLGDEGGCLCWQDGERGFWDLPQQCGTCVEGYGPRSLLEYDQWVLAQDLLAVPQLPLDSPPFSTLETLVGRARVEFFRDKVACRIPSAFNPLVETAFAQYAPGGGRGEIRIAPPTSTAYTLTGWKDVTGRLLEVPACLTVWVGGSPYDLSPLTSDVDALIYVNGTGDLLTVVNGTPYLGGSPCLLGNTIQDDPWIREMTCGGDVGVGEVHCENLEYGWAQSNLVIKELVGDRRVTLRGGLGPWKLEVS